MNEIEFLENYYKFYISSGKDIKSFKGIAKLTLVDTGQISGTILDSFCDGLLIEEQISFKKSQVAILEREIKELSAKLPLYKIGRKPNVTPGSQTTRSDGCGTTRSTPRGGC